MAASRARISSRSFRSGRVPGGQVQVLIGRRRAGRGLHDLGVKALLIAKVVADRRQARPGAGTDFADGGRLKPFSAKTSPAAWTSRDGVSSVFSSMSWISVQKNKRMIQTFVLNDCIMSEAERQGSDTAAALGGSRLAEMRARATPGFGALPIRLYNAERY